jgi:uncharacterized protein (TIGR02246 family)
MKKNSYRPVSSVGGHTKLQLQNIKKMKKIFMTFLFASLNLLLFAQEKDSTASETVIKSIIQKQEEEWNRHDFKAFCNFYTDDATFINYIGMFWKGKKEIEAHFDAITDCCLASTSVKLDFKDLRFLSPDIAVAQSEETIVADKAYNIPDHNYKQGETEYKMITQVFIKENNEWKITAQQLTAIDQFYTPHNAVK